MAHFYKYVVPEAGLAILEGGKLRWSTPPTLNDPFDMQFPFQINVVRETVLQKSREKRWNLYNGQSKDQPLNKLGHAIQQLTTTRPNLSETEFNSLFGNGFEKSLDEARLRIEKFNSEVLTNISSDKIFCVSSVPDDILMWSYYAGSHSGLVLRFDSNVAESPLAEAQPIQYVEHMPLLYDEETLSDLIAGYVALTTEMVLDRLVYTKYKSWTHEQEWRVYSGGGRTKERFEDISFNPMELDGVVFGARATDDFRRKITEIVSNLYPHADLLRIRPCPDRFHLDIISAN